MIDEDQRMDFAFRTCQQVAISSVAVPLIVVAIFENLGESLIGAAASMILFGAALLLAFFGMIDTSFGSPRGPGGVFRCQALMAVSALAFVLAMAAVSTSILAF